MMTYIALGLSSAGICAVPAAFASVGRDFLAPLCVYTALFCIVWIDRSVLYVVNHLDVNGPVLGLISSSHYSLLFLIIWSYLTAMLASPGYTVLRSGKKKFESAVNLRLRSRLSEQPDLDIRQLRKSVKKRVAQQLRYCKQCESVKPASTHHCKACKRCVHKMDHHCPWINNCVGKCNMKYFLQFLLYTEVGITLSLALMAAVGTGAVKTTLREELLESWDLRAMYVCSLLLMTFFACFVAVMIYEQYEALSSGIPGIDALQGIGKWRDRTLYTALREDAFGGNDISLFWFLPLPSAQLEPKEPRTKRSRRIQVR